MQGFDEVVSKLHRKSGPELGYVDQ